MSDAPLPNSAPSPQTDPRSPEIPALLSRSPVFVTLRLFIYIALAAGITIGVQWILAPFLDGMRSPYAPRVLAVTEASSFAGVFFAGLAMSRLEGQPFGRYGLPLRGAFGKLFWQGALFGLVEISVVISVIAAFGSYHFGSLAIHGTELLRWAAMWTVMFIVVALYEELAFRGYTQFTLAQAAGFWPAAVLLSVAFGLVHITNRGESKLGIAGVMVTGLFWCLTLRRTGNLWFAVGMHASFDFGETFLFSVPDSGGIFPGHLSNATLAGPWWLTGGNTGPEASVCDFVVLLLFFYIFHRLYPARTPAVAIASGSPE